MLQPTLTYIWMQVRDERHQGLLQMQQAQTGKDRNRVKALERGLKDSIKGTQKELKSREDDLGKLRNDYAGMMLDRSYELREAKRAPWRVWDRTW
jgi:uncharacterized protein HemX